MNIQNEHRIFFVYPFFLIFKMCRKIVDAFSWFYFMPRKVGTDFSLFLTLELKSGKISYNYLRHEIKSGKRIANFPVNFKNEGKKDEFFFHWQKITKYYLGLEIQKISNIYRVSRWGFRRLSKWWFVVPAANVVNVLTGN